MRLQHDIDKLTREGVISEETASKIRGYYQKQDEGRSQNRLHIAFAITGAILTGLGIVLIVAHKWHELPKTAKLAIAFFPLAAGQLLAGFAMLKKRESAAWRESAATFLFFAIGACIAMVSRIYRLPDDLPTYILTWVLLALPLVYLMRSSAVSSFYLIAIMIYAFETAEIPSYPHSPYFYWPLLALVLPHYYRLLKIKPESNFTLYHNWIFPFTLAIALGTLTDYMEELMVVVYMSLFGIYYMTGNLPFFRTQKLIRNSYLILGSAGMVALMLFMSFDDFWKHLRAQEFTPGNFMNSGEFYAAVILSILAIVMLFIRWKDRARNPVRPQEPFFLIFIIIFIIGFFTPLSPLFINLALLIIGAWIALDGARENNLGMMNYGLIIIMALAAARFFDQELSFALRGSLFILAGVGFLYGNYRLIKKRRANE